MNNVNRSSTQHRPWFAFGISIPIGMLGGLIGLGGAEFRLPVLASSLRYNAKRAVALNLAVSLITVITSLLIRSRTLPLGSLQPLAPSIAALILGAVISAFWGTSQIKYLTNMQLERIILALLLAIGSGLILEAFLPKEVPTLLPEVMSVRFLVGILFGLVIGLVSSLLGVAGGELIIPTLVFAFGVDIKTAGTASLLISLPVVFVGVLRYARQGAFTERAALTNTVAPMGIGSVIGALIGGVLVGIVSVSALKLGLGIILIVSAVRIFRHRSEPE